MSRGRKPSVVYWGNQPAPYVVARLNAVAERGNITIEAWFDRVREADRRWDVTPSDWFFPARFITRTASSTLHRQIPLAELQTVRPDVLVATFDRAHTALGLVASKALAGRTAIRCLPAFDSWSADPPPMPAWLAPLRGRTARTLTKRFLFHMVDGAKVPGPAGSGYAERFGLPRPRSWPVTQGIDLDLYRRAALMTGAERAAVRDALGLRGCVFAYIGRLWSGKGLDHLFDAFAKVRRIHHDASLLVIGDGDDEHRLRRKAEDRPGIIFAGHVQPRDLPRWQALADVLVFPTLGDPHGLVVEEAMAAGLPVISSDCAGDIRRRIVEGVTGFVVPAGSSDPLARRMLTLAGDPALRARMSNAAARSVGLCGVEQYAIDFERFVDEIMAAPPRANLAARLAQIGGRGLLLTARRPPAPRLEPAGRGSSARTGAAVPGAFEVSLAR